MKLFTAFYYCTIQTISFFVAHRFLQGLGHLSILALFSPSNIIRSSAPFEVPLLESKVDLVALQRFLPGKASSNLFV